MLLALPVTWFLWKRCVTAYDCGNMTSPTGQARHQRIKALCLVVFGSRSRFATEPVRSFMVPGSAASRSPGFSASTTSASTF